MLYEFVMWCDVMFFTYCLKEVLSLKLIVASILEDSYEIWWNVF